MALQLNGTDGVTFNDGSEQWAAASPIGTKNLIINGNMQIAQRGTSVSGITTGGYFTVDRFAIFPNALGTWTNTQSTDVPLGQGFSNSYKLECTTADASPAAADVLTLQYRIEAQNCQYLNYGTSSAKTTTLSFWVKSNKTGTYNFNLRKDDDNRRIVKQYTISSADTWEKKTITIEGDTSGTINNDNGIGLQLVLWLGAGSDFTTGSVPTGWGVPANADFAPNQVNLADSTSNYINITGVQLEVGDTATPFEHVPYDMNLARCQRYYEKSYDIATVPGAGTGTGMHIHGGNNAGATTSFLSCGSCNFKVTKRAIPTLTIYDYVGNVGVSARFQLGLAGSPNENWTLDSVSTRTIFSYSANGASRSGAGFHFVANAEL